MKNLFDKCINLTIDAIHRAIVIYRERKPQQTENELDLSRFTLTFEDHFDGEALDTGVWNHYRQGERKGGYWEKEQAFLKDGN
ncbi:MAG: hypothetical protein II789_02395, partial [Clostridia bacterium]|nr:hypothetical protein [Clostridia bacterium]